VERRNPTSIAALHFQAIASFAETDTDFAARGVPSSYNFVKIAIASSSFKCFATEFPMSSIPHVALLIETSRTYTRNILRGVKRYMSECGPWSVYLEMRAPDSRFPPWLKSWRGDGILCRSYSQDTIDAIVATGVPAVELRASKLIHNLPFVGVDNRALGQMVATHFVERGFRHFGCYEIDTEVFFEERRDNFVQALSDRGFSCELYRSKRRSEHPLKWEQQQAELVAWVRQLAKPVAILACTDQLGFWLLDACHRAGIAVPTDVAVVGVEDDESLCEMATPPMSSVHFAGARIGYEAAKLLDELMRGQDCPREPLLISPMDIVVRGSSDVVAIDDPLVAQALRYIREQARRGIQVEDVAGTIGCSRSTLERRMRHALNRSPQEEIVRVKLNAVRELLTETTLPLDVIAERTGFRHAQYLVELFRNQFDITPGQYRKNTRPPEK
jgi:LacI family transcriptional regulator